MRGNLGKLILYFSCLIGLLLATFVIKQVSEISQIELAEITQQIEYEKQSISVLTAERSFLRRPIRIATLASRHLGAELSKTTQIAGYNKTNKRTAIATRTNVRWRYKKPSGEHITLTSKKR